MFVERVFGGKRLFGDSPTGQALGVGLRVGDPGHDAPNAHRWLGRLIVWSTVLISAGAAVGLYGRRQRRKRRWWGF